MPTVHVSPLFKKVQNWQDWAVEFKEYKCKGILPDNYGRDEQYRREIWHMHLAQTAAITRRWSKIDDQFRRTTPMGQPQNDYWLLYAYDDYNDKYLLLLIIGPNAHNDPAYPSMIGALLSDIVDPWMAGRLSYPAV